MEKKKNQNVGTKSAFMPIVFYLRIGFFVVGYLILCKNKILSFIDQWNLFSYFKKSWKRKLIEEWKAKWPKLGINTDFQTI